ncbi:DNA-directed RNA polymerase subunit H [Candidatus Micrarchaeota archaeon]|nr:DNA-directed RNA polymerase subunit H [Candidatus Micrarchaeota archaeon]
MAKKKEISFNILEHSILPKASVVTEKEKEKVLNEYSLKEENLPRIKHNDPVAKILEAEAGDVIKFDRKDPTGRYAYYRLVI